MKFTPLVITGRWLGYLTVPHFVFVYFQQSSVGIGLLFVSMGLLVFYAAKGRLAITSLQLATLFVIFLSIVSSCLLFDSSAINRQLVSFICIGLVCVATNGLFRDVALRRPEVVRAVISNAFWFLVLIGITGKLRLFDPGVYAGYPKPIFPFAEESHYALTLGVIACIYMTQIQPRLRLGIPILLLGFAAWFPNTTMLCSALMLTAVLFSFRTLLAWTALIGAIFCIMGWINSSSLVTYYSKMATGDSKLVLIMNVFSGPGALLAMLLLGLVGGLRMAIVGQLVMLGGVFWLMSLDELNRINADCLKARLLASSPAAIFALVCGTAAHLFRGGQEHISAVSITVALATVGLFIPVALRLFRLTTWSSNPRTAVAAVLGALPIGRSMAGFIGLIAGIWPA